MLKLNVNVVGAGPVSALNKKNSLNRGRHRACPYIHFTHRRDK